MTFLGANTEHLRDIGRSIHQATGRLDNLLTAIADASRSVQWSGPDADAFREEVQAIYHRGTAVSSMLQERSAQLKQHAVEQDVASGREDSEGVSPAADRTNHKKFADVVGPLSKLFRDGDDVERDQGALKLLKTIADHISRKVGNMDDDLPPGGKRLLKIVPFLGAVPDLAETVEALKNGDTGGVIGNGMEALMAASPDPISELATVLNDFTDGHLPSGKSWMETVGDVAGGTYTVKLGEHTGSMLSDVLGFEDGGTADNVTQSSYGAAVFGMSFFPPTQGSALGLTNLGSVHRLGEQIL